MKHFRRLIALVAAAGLIAGGWPAPAQAHVLESDGNIAAVLHIPPDDAPVAGQPTSIGLAFASGQSGFDLADYAVMVSLKQGTTRILTAPLMADAGSSHDGSASLTFPAAGAYQLEVDGRALRAGRPFHLEYSLRAGFPAGSDTAGKDGAGSGRVGIDFWVLNAGALAVLLMAAQYQIRLGGRYAAPPVQPASKPFRKH